ncbi:cytochrome c [Wenzhouxiangella sp. XN201]|uniref:cytochrome c4 n=1 Tax=Wenzhouxiangella sp. XN201 TaxID=2710755 RepID=UPI0013C8AC2A|nr:c-type cytochrome [Wenzhouxiangella sp. XN201]NEZ02971.1 cytochrome c [Wenzhouxiangella sp. XN201]
MWIKRTFKWIGLTLLGIVGLAAIAVILVYILMGRDLARSYDITGEDIAVPSDAASIEEGQRLAQLRGCSGGCHGRTTTGGVMIELFDGTRVVAPDLGELAARYSTKDLERAIRHGVKPDGTSVLRIMPSEMLSTLSDRDLGLILAYLRSQPAGEQTLPESRYGPVARVMGFFFKRKFGSLLAAEVIDHQHSPPPEPSDEEAYGRYLANTVCTECHGSDLRGSPDGSTPSLAVVLAYSREDFETLMRAGEPLGGQELGLMAGVARSRFVRFTDDEIAALHGYLSSPDNWSD